MKRIIIGVTGSIACYRACDLISQLRKDPDTEIQVVMTREAAQFVTPLTFQTLSGRKAYADLFEAPEEWDLLHTALSAEADLVAVVPATLNMIGKLANGICDDLLTSVVFATKAPVLLAPAMNPAMYAHPVNQENIAKLKKIGYQFVGPVHGEVACRQIGMGHIAETADIAEAIRRAVKQSNKKRGRE